ncbi:hypothetical protein NBRC116493_01490 [Aurantivibrio infirmus]
MRIIVSSLLLGLFGYGWVGLCAAAELAPFSSDGCSDFPDGTLQQKTLWLDCCTAHDRSYWLGGTQAEREFADKELQSCVAGVGEPEIALLMLAGVRVGGSPYWITRYRWGYGWPYWQGWRPRGYRVLSEDEKLQVELLESQAEKDKPSP